MAGGLALLATIGIALGPHGIDEFNDWKGQDEYLAPRWMEAEALAPAAFGKFVAAAAQEENIVYNGQVADTRTEVNIFQFGIKGEEEGMLLSPFQRATGLHYAVMATISKGNPKFELAGTEGGVLPVSTADVSRITAKLGLENYATDVEVQATVFERVLNEIAGSQWTENARNGVYRNAISPQLEQELWMKDTFAKYVESIGIKIDGTPLNADQLSKFGAVLYALTADYNQLDSKVFEGLLGPEGSPVRASFADAQTVVIESAKAGLLDVDELVLPEAVAEDIEAAQKASQAQG